jgi:hypothetical protein
MDNQTPIPSTIVKSVNVGSVGELVCVVTTVDFYAMFDLQGAKNHIRMVEAHIKRLEQEQSIRRSIILGNGE